MMKIMEINNFQLACSMSLNISELGGLKMYYKFEYVDMNDKDNDEDN